MKNTDNFDMFNKIYKLWYSETAAYTSLKTISVFLHVAMNPGSNSEEIQKATGLSQTDVSRHTIELSRINRLKKPGYNFIYAKSDPFNRRRKIYILTKKGETFLKRLKAAYASYNEGKTLKLVAYSRDNIFEVNNFIGGVKVVGQDEFWKTIHHHDELKVVIGAEVDSYMYDAIKAKCGQSPLFKTNTPKKEVNYNKTKGIRKRGKKWALDKLYKGIRLTGSHETLEEAEQTLMIRIAEIDSRKRKMP